MKEEYSNAAAELKFRQKRKWQIALRRYVIEKQFSATYAPYFGIDIKSFREWIELQLDEELRWDTFGKAWQLDHIIPVVYFDQDDTNDLRLCWNFTNIRVERTHLHKFRGNRVDVLTAKAYFEDLFNSTGYFLCYEMIRKIEQLEIAQIKTNTKMDSFILDHFDHLTILQGFTEYEFQQLNSGKTTEEILEERQMLLKFGQ